MSSLISSEMRKFDQVNRMSIPPQFREDLGSPVIIVKSVHGDPCLSIYSEKEYSKFKDALLRNYKGRQQTMAERQLASLIDRALVDKSGRISLKEDFKAFAQLDEDVFVVGLENRVELWNKEVWEDYNLANQIDFSAVSLYDPDAVSKE